MKPSVLRVEICGGIASGKTTLATILRIKRLTPIFENFQRNPFYKAFYKDPVGTAFETELTFLLQHYHQQKEIAGTNSSFCADFSMILDRSYAFVTLSGPERRLFRLVQAKVEANLPPRSLLVSLECDPEVQLRRIKRRQRRAERSITLEYLTQLNDRLAMQVGKLASVEKVLLVRSDSVNFARDPKAQQHVRREIIEALPSF